jgi:hypothetical protein
VKRWIKIAAVAFLAFELWRFVIVGRSLLPFWNNRLLPEIISIGDYPPWIMAVVILVTFVAFVVPMAGVIFALRFVHRRLSRFRTAR